MKAKTLEVRLKLMNYHFSDPEPPIGEDHRLVSQITQIFNMDEIERFFGYTILDNETQITQLMDEVKFFIAEKVLRFREEADVEDA